MNKVNAFVEGHFLASVVMIGALNAVLGWWFYVAVFAKL